MARNEDVSIKGRHTFRGLDPSFGRSILFQMNQRLGPVCRNDVAGENNLFPRKKNHEVATRVCRSPVV